MVDVDSFMGSTREQRRNEATLYVLCEILDKLNSLTPKKEESAVEAELESCRGIVEEEEKPKAKKKKKEVK